ncbi:flagellin [Hyphomonas sp.]|uniref:flagellin N-terminal helical domain-containing protein n=1 Tax=Hyphomonas sp. TaxID=87 RepID=UPI0039191C14
MSSILTNNSAMVALETLRGINRNLATVQNEISTGKKVANAKDNAAVWAISTVMSTDVSSFKQITDSLNLGVSTIAVARSAAESVTEKLGEIKNLIVAAQGENVDRAKLQADIEQKVGSIQSIVSAAQFNGLNLINGSSATDMRVLASLDRAPNGNVSAAYIDVARQDLSFSTSGAAATFGATAVNDTTIINNGGTNAGTSATVADGASRTISIESVGEGYSYRVRLNDSGAAEQLFLRNFEYVASAGDSSTDVAANLVNQIQSFFTATGATGYTVAQNGADIVLTNDSGGNLAVTAFSSTGGTAGVAAGGLGGLALIDVSTGAGAAAALASIEGLIQTGINASAAFGSAQNRVAAQGEFVQKLVDSMTSGIGTLVDADMEAASAKLQALQVQQQLGIQALSIANQSPQSLLSLFR